MMPEKTIPALLNRLIDYAGLFPPARLDMKPAVEEFARQRRSGDAWILSRFVVPLGRLEEFEAAARPHFDDRPWPLSVLVSGDPKTDRDCIDNFNKTQTNKAQAGAVIESVELKASSTDDIARLAPTFTGLEAYFEIPHQGDPAPLMTALAEHGGRAKIRTGGIVADAMPASVEVARFIRAAAQAGVPFKATAGLHHPLRGEYRLTYEPDADFGLMHGYFNVFLASALVHKTGLAESEVIELLEQRSTEAFRVDGENLQWRDYRLTATDLKSARTNFATSYGSCSFREPVDELKELQLL